MLLSKRYTLRCGESGRVGCHAEEIARRADDEAEADAREAPTAEAAPARASAAANISLLEKRR